MRRVELVRYGPPRQALRHADVPMPVPGPHDVVVHVAAAGLNPIDVKLVRGELRAIVPLRRPAPLGFDAAGTIAAVGTEVSGWSEGDRVFVRAPRQHLGSLAEALVVDAGLVATAPKGLTAVEAASLPLVALTTVQALEDRAQARPGQSVLVHAGSGGLGSFAVQYAARHLGLHVTTTTSSRNAAWVADLGADVVVAYDREAVADRPDRYDVVFDTLGGATLWEAFRLVRRGGMVVSVAGPPDAWFARASGAPLLLAPVLLLAAVPPHLRALIAGARYRRFLTESDGAALARIADVVATGAVRPILDSTFPFDATVAAMEHLATGRAKGKVVVEIGKGW